MKLITKGVHDDFVILRRGEIPPHIDVTIRCTISCFLSYVMAAGNFSSVIPQSQRTLIATLVPTLTMLSPTLMFSIGAILFPNQMILTISAYGIATMLLACAAGVGRNLYVAMYGITALLVSGARFDTKTGSSTTILMMQVALNTVNLFQYAETGGQDFVKSTWTETGVENPKAIFTNGLVGMAWVLLFIIAGRLLPPFETARALISKKLLPHVLNYMADYVLLNYEPDDITSSYRSFLGIDEDADKDAVNVARQEKRDQLVETLVEKKALLNGGAIAGKTAFEPRMMRFGPPKCLYAVLAKLCGIIDHCALATLALDSIFRCDVIDVEKKGKLAPIHQKAISNLRKCAEALKSGRIQPQDLTQEADAEAEAEAEQSDEDADRTADNRYDAMHLSRLSKEIITATEAWIRSIAPPDRSSLRSYFDKDAREATKKNIVPWIGASFGVWLSVGKSFCKIMKVDTWTPVLQPPYDNEETKKFIWCVKFAVGFTALVCMSVYWEAFASFLIPVQDEGAPVSAHFSGWYLIAYSMSTTQTTEGTVRKGLLRLVGTLLGGFSGWLAITACGNDNAVGLIAWATVVSFLATYVSLSRGDLARMGIEADYGYSSAIFVLTNSLVIFDVYLGIGGKNDITLNRIVANSVGIAFAIFLAILPPGWYGGDPKLAQTVLSDQKQTLSESLKFLTERGNEGAEVLVPELEEMRTTMKTKTHAVLLEAKAFYSDANKLRKLPKVCKADPELGRNLNSLQVLGSFVYVVSGFVKHILEHSDLRQKILKEEVYRNRLEYHIKALESEAGSVCSAKAAAMPHHKATKGEGSSDGEDDEDDKKPQICNDIDLFLWYVAIACKKLKAREEGLSSIKFGLLS